MGKGSRSRGKGAVRTAPVASASIIASMSKVGHPARRPHVWQKFQSQ
jgi:hypothetical protein